jgi:hypothetical protein
MAWWKRWGSGCENGCEKHAILQRYNLIKLKPEENFCCLYSGLMTKLRVSCYISPRNARPFCVCGRVRGMTGCSKREFPESGTIMFNGRNSNSIRNSADAKARCRRSKKMKTSRGTIIFDPLRTFQKFRQSMCRKSAFATGCDNNWSDRLNEGF